MMMRNKVEELAPLNSFVITFQIYEIKEGRPKDFTNKETDFDEFANPCGRQRGEGNGNQTIEETTNTN